MSEDDVFTRATRALRESVDGSSERAEETRARVLASAERGGRRRRHAISILLPLAAALVVSTAWGAVTGRIPGWLGRGMSVGRAERSSDAPPPLQAAPVTEESTPTPWPTAPSPPPDAGIDVPNSPALTVPSRASAPRPPSSSVPRSPTLVSSREQTMYSSAHAAHFAGRDPGAALRAWDDYLAAYPEGRFALEARYNRTICLVRLSRSDEARAALRVFADGTRGGYRQSEARELLNALDALDGGSTP